MRPAAKSLADLWRSLEADTLPDLPGEVREHLRKAFYCGAAATMHAMLAAQRLPGRLATVEMNALKEEVQAWAVENANAEAEQALRRDEDEE